MDLPQVSGGQTIGRGPLAMWFEMVMAAPGNSQSIGQICLQLSG